MLNIILYFKNIYVSKVHKLIGSKFLWSYTGLGRSILHQFGQHSLKLNTWLKVRIHDHCLYAWFFLPLDVLKLKVVLKVRGSRSKEINVPKTVSTESEVHAQI